MNRFATSQRPQHAFAAAPAFRDEVIGGMHRPALLAFLHGCSDQQSDVPPTDQAKLRAVVRDMNRAGYVSPVLSKRFEFGGKVRMLKVRAGCCVSLCALLTAMRVMFALTVCSVHALLTLRFRIPLEHLSS